MNLQGLIALLLLTDPGQILLRAFLQNLFILNRVGNIYLLYLPLRLPTYIPDDLQGLSCQRHSLAMNNLRGSHLAEAFQHVLHLLIASEEVSQGLFNGIEVGQGLVLLHDQLLDGVVGERLLFLVVL